MKTLAGKILERFGQQNDAKAEISWLTPKNKFPFELNILSTDNGIPHINVFEKNTNRGAIKIPQSLPKSIDDIIVLDGSFSSEEKTILLNILSYLANDEIEIWDLAKVVWNGLHGGF